VPGEVGLGVGVEEVPGEGARFTVDWGVWGVGGRMGRVL
jgi:hypothetical protein